VSSRPGKATGTNDCFGLSSLAYNPTARGSQPGQSDWPGCRIISAA